MADPRGGTTVSNSTSDSKPCSPSWLLFVVGLVGVIIGIVLMMFYIKSELDWFNTESGVEGDGVEPYREGVRPYRPITKD